MLGWLFRLIRKPSLYTEEAYWLLPLDDFAGSTEEFLGAIESEIRRREMPGVEVTRLVEKENRFVSAWREFLRVRREYIYYDVIAGEFGKCWYFSSRGCVRVRRITPFEALVTAATLGSFGLIYAAAFGLLGGALAVLATIAAIVLLLKLTGRWQGMDDFLLNLPVLGFYYERWVRWENYRRLDTRWSFVEIVDKIVRNKVKELVALQGVDKPEFVEFTNWKHRRDKKSDKPKDKEDGDG